MSSKMPQPEVQMIKLHKNSNGMGLSIVAAKGAGQVSFLICYKVVKVFMKNLCQITLQYINQKNLSANEFFIHEPNLFEHFLCFKNRKFCFFN